MQISLFCFVAHRFQPFLAFHAKDFDSVGRHVILETARHPSFVFPLHQITHPCLAGQFQNLQRHPEGADRIRGIIQSHGTHLAPFLFDIFHQHITASFMLHDVCLKPQRILVQGNQFLVAEQFQRLLRNPGQVTSDQQRRTHDTPHAEMRLFLFRFQTASDLQHVHIVVMPASRISREIQVHINAAFHGCPVRSDVRTDSPGTGQIPYPGPRISPAADIQGNIPGTDFPDRPYDLRIALLFVQFQLLAGPAIVYLDKVESPFIEKQVCILAFKAVQPYPDAMLVGIPDRSAGIGPGLRIDSGLESE